MLSRICFRDVKIEISIDNRTMHLLKVLKSGLSPKVALLRKWALINCKLLLIMIHPFLIGLQALMRILVKLESVLLLIS
jgi:hypothetical protein